MAVAYFDNDGICMLISSHDIPDSDYPYSAEILDTLKPINVWYNKATSSANISQPVNLTTLLAVEPVVHVGDTLTLFVPENCVLEINGVRHSGLIVHQLTEPMTILLRLMGQQVGETIIEVRSYIQDRASAYPTAEEQLDYIYHYGLDAWRDMITQIKSKFPKTT
jgi:hypothetical protein